MSSQTVSEICPWLYTDDWPGNVLTPNLPIQLPQPEWLLPHVAASLQATMMHLNATRVTASVVFTPMLILHHSTFKGD